MDKETLEIRLIDFGSVSAYHLGFYRIFRGTLICAPPEYWTEKVYAADSFTAWSVGLILYNMVCGKFPFKSKLHIMFPKFFPSIFENVDISESCKNLICLCLATVPDKRITMDEISSHPWLVTAD